jgi:hypothetical protein
MGRIALALVLQLSVLQLAAARGGSGGNRNTGPDDPK